MGEKYGLASLKKEVFAHKWVLKDQQDSTE